MTYIFLFDSYLQNVTGAYQGPKYWCGKHRRDITPNQNYILRWQGPYAKKHQTIPGSTTQAKSLCFEVLTTNLRLNFCKCNAVSSLFLQSCSCSYRTGVSYKAKETQIDDTLSIDCIYIKHEMATEAQFNHDLLKFKDTLPY